MTYAYVAPFFVSAAFQMVTQAQHRRHSHSYQSCAIASRSMIAIAIWP